MGALWQHKMCLCFGCKSVVSFQQKVHFFFLFLIQLPQPQQALISQVMCLQKHTQTNSSCYIGQIDTEICPVCLHVSWQLCSVVDTDKGSCCRWGAAAAPCLLSYCHTFSSTTVFLWTFALSIWIIKLSFRLNSFPDDHIKAYFLIIYYYFLGSFSWSFVFNAYRNSKVSYQAISLGIF